MKKKVAPLRICKIYHVIITLCIKLNEVNTNAAAATMNQKSGLTRYVALALFNNHSYSNHCIRQKIDPTFI